MMFFFLCFHNYVSKLENARRAIFSFSVTFIAKKSIAEVRQLYFCMKNQVFAKSWFGRTGNHNNTLALESILKKTLGAETRMSDIKEPK